jgi:hypothetical protein
MSSVGYLGSGLRGVDAMAALVPAGTRAPATPQYAFSCPCHSGEGTPNYAALCALPARSFERKHDAAHRRRGDVLRLGAPGWAVANNGVTGREA